MPRPQRSLEPEANPVHAFAAELRALRESAGNPTYLKMARASGKSRTALAEAAGGDHIPRWETVEAYVRACGADPTEWRSKWEAIRSEREADTPNHVDERSSDVPEEAAAAKSRRRRLMILVAVVLVLATAAVFVIISLQDGPSSGGAPPSSPTSSVPRPPGPIAIVVQNKVAIGTELLEDFTPAYLSSKPIPFCRKQGCKLEGTEMSSGAVLAVDCHVTGAEMSNADLSSPGIDQNPHKYSSALWYRAVLPGDRSGYLSEVYVAPQHRGGFGLPECAPGQPIAPSGPAGAPTR